MTRLALSALAALALGLFPAGASAATQDVDVLFAEFSPTPLDVLPGETVEWSNDSDRRHTVTADDDSFDSGDLLAGDHFARTFTTVGAYPYHCTVHAGMVGEVDVRRITLGTLPSAAVLAGTPVDFEGRTADPSGRVTIEFNKGSGFRPVGLATPAADGDWKATLTAQTTGNYRAVVGADTSQTRRLLVSNRKVIIRPTRRGVAVRVTPAAPYARIILQVHLRERFGWWPARRARLDFVSRATFKVKRPARVRAVLVGKDAWTPLASSTVLNLGHVPRRRMPRHMGH
jgi:plastocyanin